MGFMRNVSLMAAMIILMGGLAACGQKSSSAANDAVLVGTWATACMVSNGASQKTTDLYTSTNVTVTNEVFTDAQCATAMYVVVQSSSYVIGDGVIGLDSTSKLDSTLATFTGTPANAASAATLNSQNLCGVSDWKTGTTQDLLGKACDSANPDGEKAGRVHYDIFQVKGSTLHLGDIEGGKRDGSTDAKRPVKLDTTNAFTKQ